jgi:hypothetical protein
MMRLKNPARAAAFAIALLPLALAAQAAPEASYEFKLKPGFAYGQYGPGTWLRREDGSRIDPYGLDAGRATWKQLTGRLTLSVSQGLIANPDPDMRGQDLLTLSLAYAASYYRKLQDLSPDAFIYGTSRPEAGIDVLQNKVSLILDFKDYRGSKLYNTRRGAVGQLILDAAPRALGNDVLGLCDYYRFSANIRNYVPVIEGRLFSMYLYEALAYDAAWGAYIPVQEAYSATSIAVRNSFLPDGFTRLAHSLELRASFPAALDSGTMPGFSLFYDCGLYDDYDYAFSLDRFEQAIGAAFIMHMDSIAILPVSAQLDLQFGATYAPGRGTAKFYFNVLFPYDSQL